MSVIGGIYTFETSVAEESLTALRQVLNIRSRDGGTEVRAGSVAMVYRAFHTNRESRSENQPVVSNRGHVLCWDGRLDNRDDVMAKLKEENLPDVSDAAIVMACYLHWGFDFPRQIIGDFALSLWDPQLKTLLLARDPIGVRLLYYHTNNERIIWSTKLSALLDTPGIALEVNQDYIADFIGRIPDPAQTPYKNINGVPPAHVVIVKDKCVRTVRYWGLDPNAEIRYQTDTEYEEHFRHLFREAVRCRLRTDGPACAELSGGLDSSAIVCMSDDIIRNGEAQASRLVTVSRIFDEAAKSDERKYIRLVEEKIGKQGHHLREDDYRISSPLEEIYSSTIPNPIGCAAEYYRALDNSMQMSGARVLLSGHGGDEILNSVHDPSPELADLLVERKIRRLHERLKVWSNALHTSYFRLLWQSTLMPILPRQIRALGNREFKRRQCKLYRREFLKGRGVYERRFKYGNVFGFHTPSGRDQSICFLRAVGLIAAGYHRQFTDVEISYPFTHRRLIEFTQAIPFDQKVRPRDTRSILRRALRDLLPEEIANRKGKGHIADAYMRAMAREWPRIKRLFADARICNYGYVRPEGLSELVEHARHGNDPKALHIAYLLPLEYWLRAFEQRRYHVLAANY
jgi:asparagine synthase (glutamine-hydrolysing)